MAGDVRHGGGQLVGTRACPTRQDGPETAGPRTTGPRPAHHEVLAFAAVGLLAYAVDLALFTCLRGPAALDPLTAKAVSFVAGCTVAYAGNARGTYRHARRRGLRPYAAFFAVNAAGAVVQLLCLTLSLPHSRLRSSGGTPIGLGLTSQLADTVSGAGIGMALATVLRFWGTRTLVFPAEGRVGSWTG
ncbi:GtrA family protein [Streptomyces chartreusis]|uniref:GtrA family protein n=1 Tax=Streptomyces chartreusis TaxID=1969 RepID=UPI003700F4F6